MSVASFYFQTIIKSKIQNKEFVFIILALKNLII